MNEPRETHDELQARLGSLWAEVLECELVGPRQHFLDLGGTSILAMLLATRIEDELGVVVPISTFFFGGTIEAVAAAIAEATAPPGAARRPRPLPS